MQCTASPITRGTRGASGLAVPSDDVAAATTPGAPRLGTAIPDLPELIPSPLLRRPDRA
jgi:hypothetical protein